MKKASILIEEFKDNKHQERLREIYLDDALLEKQKARYSKALKEFISLFGDLEVEIYSAPGRSEICGNHTDHQHGCVVAAAINLDIIAVVAKDDLIEIQSDAIKLKKIELTNLEYVEKEEGSSEALVKGVVSRMKELGYTIGGFKGYFTSDVLIGSGLSSSAAFEVLIGTILSGLYNQMAIDPVVIAQIGQFAENHYFGKPSGLMDQSASSVGGMITIDFKDVRHPKVEKIDVDFSKFGYCLCIVDTKGTHANLTNEYASIPFEMKMVAEMFEVEFLTDVIEQQFYQNINAVRKKCGDRSVLRAIHLFEENKRVKELVQALRCNDFTKVKESIVASGNSSYKLLQNIYVSKDVQHQEIAIGLALSKKILKDQGFCRVHGGGFAGTIQAFVKENYVATYKKEIEQIFGEDACYVLQIRKYGGIKF